MKIGILLFSKRPKDASATCAGRLEQAARELGHEPIILRAPDLDFTQPLPPVDVILCRPNFIEEPSLHTYVVEHFAQAGIPLVNGAREALLAKNKLHQHMRLEQAGVPQPRFAIANSTDVATDVAQKIGYPVILKVAFGTHGIGVFYAADEQTLRPIADYLSLHDGNPIIIEEFIRPPLTPPYPPKADPPPADKGGGLEAFPPFSKGGLRGGSAATASDIRAFVIGNHVAAAMQRTAKAGDFRANAAQDGACASVELSQTEQDLAVRAAQTLDCDLAGVDIMRTPHGPVVLEVNINPGFLELESATGTNVAQEIIRFIAKN